MNFIKDPVEIETRSMELIAPYLSGLNLDATATKIFSRVIHAAGDPDYANHVRIQPGAVEAAMSALRGGADIFCDVEMVRTGISKKTLALYGGQVHCLIADPAVAALAKQRKSPARWRHSGLSAINWTARWSRSAMRRRRCSNCSG